MTSVNNKSNRIGIILYDSAYIAGVEYSENDDYEN